MEQEARKVLRVILLRTIPGVGLITELAIVATAGDIDQSRNG
jgi:transposase